MKTGRALLAVITFAVLLAFAISLLSETFGRSGGEQFSLGGVLINVAALLICFAAATVPLTLAILVATALLGPKKMTKQPAENEAGPEIHLHSLRPLQ